METQISNLNPNAYWKLNETSGTTAADSSGGAYDLTATGDFVVNQTGTDGTAAYQFGTSSRGLVSGTGPTVGGNTFTLGAWLYATELPSVTASGAPTATNIFTDWVPVVALGNWTDSTNKTDCGIGIFVTNSGSTPRYR